MNTLDKRDIHTVSCVHSMSSSSVNLEAPSFHKRNQSQSKNEPMKKIAVSSMNDQLYNMSTETSTLMNSQISVKQGYLYIKKKRIHPWKRRWFVIRNRSLFCYKNEKEYEIRKLIPLNECLFVGEVGYAKYKKEKESENDLSEHNKRNMFGIVTTAKTHYFIANSEEETYNWITKLRMEVNAAKNTNIDSPEMSAQLLEQSIHDMADDEFKFSEESTSEEEEEEEEGESEKHAAVRFKKEKAIILPSENQLENVVVSSNTDDSIPPVDDKLAQLEAKTRNERLIKQGYLEKCSKKSKRWKREWYALRNDKLMCYKNDAEHKLRKIVDLSHGSDLTLAESKKQDHVFQLKTMKRIYLFAADNESERRQWFNALHSVISPSQSI